MATSHHANPEPIEVEVVDLTHDGRGVVDVEGQRLFVAGALRGETVRVLPRRRRRRLQEAELLDIVSSVPARVEPPCAYFGRCGGCALQHLDYEAQVEFKENVVREALQRIGGVAPDRWLEPLTGPQWHYRRRARLGVRYVPGKERVLVGFKERATRLVTDMADCRVLVRPLDALPARLAAVVAGTSLRQRLPQAEIAIGDDARAVVLRVLDEPTEEDLLVFEAFGVENGLDIYLQRGGPGTVQPLTPSMARPLRYRLRDFDVTLTFAPTDFVQVNEVINEKMIGRVMDLLEAESDDRVLDLYCGLGNFSLPLARRTGAVLGVEGDAGLVARAARNGRDNAIDNVSFIAADLTQPEWSFLREPWDLVVADPPRSGAAIPVSQMRRMNPRRIAYVSCHPATLARDVKELVDSQGYRLVAAGIADMFPHTHHVEAIAVLER
ncbi:MAG TPA: 23S rRNA (uracil(1939)-C(5))-methyltransferase RlmD [Gammaproteobacteria bacterium]